MSNQGVSRRELLVSAAAIGWATLAGWPRPASAQGGTGSLHGPVDVAIPSLPEKVKNTERVGISMRTHETHLKLWQGYARKTNEIRKALSELPADPTKANQTYSQVRALKVDYTFAYQGFINHNIYFDTIGGTGGAPVGRVADEINKAFGSFETWAADWKATGLAGRGWAFLCYDFEEKRLFNYIGDAQNTYPIWNHVCILAMDVYEHAYFLDFAERRADYINAYMQVIDWEAVNARLARVVRLYGAALAGRAA